MNTAMKAASGNNTDTRDIMSSLTFLCAKYQYRLQAGCLLVAAIITIVTLWSHARVDLTKIVRPAKYSTFNFSEHMISTNSQRECRTMTFDPDSLDDRNPSNSAVIGWKGWKNLVDVISKVRAGCVKDCSPVALVASAKTLSATEKWNTNHQGSPPSVISTSVCRQVNVTSTFVHSNVKDIHVVLEARDLSVDLKPAEIGAVQRCLVMALEALTTSRKSDTGNVYFYLPSDMVADRKSTLETSAVDFPTEGASRPCMVKFNHSIRYHIWLQAIDLYCWTYKKLYGLQYFIIPT